MNKPLILVLNKIDLAPPSLVTAWRHYFKEKYPELPVVMFTSFPKDTSNNDASADPGKGITTCLHQKRVYTSLGSSCPQCVDQILLLSAHAFMHFY